MSKNKVVEVFPKGFLRGYDPFMITDTFGSPRKGRSKPHGGIDIGCPVGVPILSPYSGVVVKMRLDKNGWGLYVVIRHKYSIDSYIDILFAHLSKTISGLAIGTVLKRGQIFAYTGGAVDDVPNGGHTTGPHLHLEIQKNGVLLIDPLPFLWKTKCVLKKTGRVLQNGGVYNDKFNYTLDEDLDFKTLPAFLGTTNENTDWGATEPEEKKKKPTTVQEKYAPGIWRILKLVIDSSVENKQVLDSSISFQTGSLINFFKKVCQSPLVEFMGDTFGNQYYWIVRKPPFDKEGYQKMINLTSIELKNENIISTNLAWNAQEIYSWYQLIPYAEFFDEEYTYMPAVFFPEYASVWGSRPLSVASTYFNFIFSGRFNSDEQSKKDNNNRIIRNAVSDFKFLIESNAYHPFTRKGTITIKGDRRIKRGTVIKHTSGEYFYVDSVVNSYEVNKNFVNRMTVLNVSRGMYPAYINGKEINGKKMSYFDIIDFGKDFDVEKITFDNWREIISKWKVNLDVFGFFMTRQQVYWEQIQKDTDEYVGSIQPLFISAEKGGSKK